MIATVSKEQGGRVGRSEFAPFLEGAGLITLSGCTYEWNLSSLKIKNIMSEGKRDIT